MMIFTQRAEDPAGARSIACDDPLGLAEPIIRSTAEAAGFFSVTTGPVLDPSANVVDRADTLTLSELEEAIALLIEDRILAADWADVYLDRSFEISSECALQFTRDELLRAAVKFGWALAHLEMLAPIATADLALIFDRTSTPISALDHLFLGLELRRRGWRPATIYLPLPGRWEPAVDYDGDRDALDRALRTHVAIAQFCGQYRLGLRHAADKLTILPLLGLFGGRLHLDLSGMPWLTAMRALARIEPPLFREVLAFAQEHFIFDRDGQALSTGEEDVRFLPDVADDGLERIFLDDPRGRQLLAVTSRSVLEEARLCERLKSAFQANLDLFSGLLSAHLSRHLQALEGA